MGTTTTTTIPTVGLTAGTYTIDAGHSEVGFTLRHLGLAKIRGRFDWFDGTVTIADDPLQSSVVAHVDLRSVDTNNSVRDENLCGSDFFRVDAHPLMTFVSTGVTDDELRGDLTINGVTKPIALALDVNGVAVDNYGVTRAGFSATGEIRRSDFGVDFNAPFGIDGMLISDTVRIELEIEVVPVK
jgi:polyisoprenoid-binding protein YceI